MVTVAAELGGGGSNRNQVERAARPSTSPPAITPRVMDRAITPRSRRRAATPLVLLGAWTPPFTPITAPARPRRPPPSRGRRTPSVVRGGERRCGDPGPPSTTGGRGVPRRRP